MVSLQQECDLAAWGVNYADLQWRAGELGVSLQSCPVRPDRRSGACHNSEGSGSP